MTDLTTVLLALITGWFISGFLDGYRLKKDGPDQWLEDSKNSMFLYIGMGFAVSVFGAALTSLYYKMYTTAVFAHWYFIINQIVSDDKPKEEPHE